MGKIIVFFQVVCFLSIPAVSGELFTTLQKEFKYFDLFPEFHIQSEAVQYFGHQHEVDKRLYFFDMNTGLESYLVGYKQADFFTCGLYTSAGMGRQNTMVVFDPRYVHYGVIPGFEFRLKPLNVKTGLEHFCYHDVDTIDLDSRGNLKSKLVNKLYITGQSKNFLLSDYRRLFMEGLPPEKRSRLAWKAEWGHYIQHSIGHVPAGYIASGHDYLHETTVDLRYGFYKAGPWLFDVQTLMNWNYGQQHGIYQTYGINLSAHFLKGAPGTQLYLAYNFLDELVLRPHDKILRLGIRFYY